MSTIPYYERWWEDEAREVPLRYVPEHRAQDKMGSYGLAELDEDLDCWVVYSEDSTAIIHKSVSIGDALDTLSRL